MAEKAKSEVFELSHTIQLDRYKLDGVNLTETELGKGSYATVIEVKFRGLKCAGKTIHPVLHENERLQCFAQECELMAGLKHPNIIQFLGVSFEENCTFPMLVMELMYTSLSKCITEYGTLPQENSYSILEDVATALCYLHGSNPVIIHRDLTANNVLLTPDMRAKIADLGVAKILNLSVTEKLQMSKCPGCPAYMAPETCTLDPSYGTEADCFSYGILMIHTLSGKWPLPDGATRLSSQDPNKIIPNTEAQRRQKYLSGLNRDNPMLQLIHQCINNNPAKRPNAEEILSHVQRVASNSPLLFENSLLILQENQKLINRLLESNQQLTELSCSHDKELLEKNEKFDQQLQEEREKVKLEIEQLQSRHFTEKKVLESVNNALETDKQQLRAELKDLETKSSYETGQLRGDLQKMSTEMAEVSSKLKITEGQCTLLKNKLLQSQELEDLKGKQLETAVKEEDVKLKQLENKEKQMNAVLEVCEAKDQELAAKDCELQHKLEELEAMKKQLEALESQLDAQQKQFVSKSNQCDAIARQLSAVGTEVKLKEEELKLVKQEKIQAGITVNELQEEIATKDKMIETSNTELGHLKNDELPALISQLQMKEKVIETLSGQLQQAQEHIYSYADNFKVPLEFQVKKCADLPIAMSDPQCAVVNDRVYVGGGLTDDKTSFIGQGQVFEYNQSLNAWSTLPDCPTRLFGLVQYCGRLLLLGGIAKSGIISGVVYEFNKKTRTWEESTVPPMLKKRFQQTVISHGTVLAVFGGVAQGGNVTDSVEVFSEDSWHKAQNLPHRCCLSKSVIVGNKCYLMGGLFCLSPDAPSKAVISIHLSTLFANVSGSPQSNSRDTVSWEIYSNEECKITQYKSTPVNYGGLLLAIGGWDSHLLALRSEILVYSSMNGVWMKISDLPMERSSSVATGQLQNGEIIIAGGFERGQKRTKAVLSMSLNL